MKQKSFMKLILFVLLFSFFIVLFRDFLMEEAKLRRLHERVSASEGFRDHVLNSKMIHFLTKTDDPGEKVGIYFLESRFSYQKFPYSYDMETFFELEAKWKKEAGWKSYMEDLRAVWNDVVYFPVPESDRDTSLKVTFTDSFMDERTYGGKRGHEGTDIMASENTPGIYPVVSMTDGIVTSKGWLEKGGYRVGITALSGGYFYYAHLDSYADISVGDEVSAGDLLGFMGDTGYGKEGTTGQFPVHLHVGIYLHEKEKEMSINPYWVLKYLENFKLKYSYS